MPDRNKQLNLSRFNSKIDKTSSSNGCWLWRGTVGGDGYGQFSYGGKCYRAHRVSYTLANPSGIPKNHVVRHKCDVKACVNPEHLETGTQKDNCHDTIKRDRQKSKLTIQNVQTIRNMSSKGRATPTQLARLYSVNAATIRRILSGTSWATIPQPDMP